MTIFDLASQNSSLIFVDDSDGSTYQLSDLASLEFDNENKKLAFAYLDNSVGSISVFWSLMKSKHCLVLLSPDMLEHFKTELETLYQPNYIFDPSRTEIEGYQIWENKKNMFKSVQEYNYSIAEKIKVLMSTSGTTGSPKFVKLSEENLISNAQSIVAYLPIQSSDVTPLNLPIFYSYGLSVLITNSLKGGRIICSNDNLLKKSFWGNFEQYGYTSLAGVPFVYEILDKIGFTKKLYPSLRYFTQAGGKLQNHLLKKFGEYALQNKQQFYVMYGQTEATARMSFLDPKLTLDKMGSIGMPIPNGSFFIDEKTSELCYKGANIYGGYAQQLSDLVSYQQETLLRTGDIAKRDEEGFYYITGRLARFTKLFGNRINLDEVESLVSKQLKIEAKCVGKNDSQLLIFCNIPDADLPKISQLISAELKLPISVIKSYFIEQYPLTNNGKINYAELIHHTAN